MTNVNADNIYQEDLLTELGSVGRNKAVTKDKVHNKGLFRPQFDVKVKEEIINDLYIGFMLTFLGFIGFLLYTGEVNFLPLLHFAVTFFICLFIPCLAVLDAPVFILFFAGFGLAFIFVAKKCPTKIRLILFTLLFAGWIYIGYQTMYLAFSVLVPFAIL